NSNIFPVVLNLYTSNFDAVINIISYLIPLNKRIIMNIKSKPTIIFIYIIYYTSNIP
ncbi:hypothetical protein QBC45DRAFT_316555, partial [Copromyces sp. CBS 386.78]